MKELYSIEQLKVMANGMLEGNSEVVNLQQIKEILFNKQGLVVVEFEDLYRLDEVNI